MSNSGTEHIEDAKERVLGDADREVWVVEWATGGHWRVSAVLTSYSDAERYRDDLRDLLNHYPEEFPEDYKKEYEVKIRHGSRDSPTKMYESYPRGKNAE